MSEFKVGDKVKWKSQAGGSVTKKKGTVVYVLTEGQVPIRVAAHSFRNHRRMFDGLGPPGRQYPAYLIEVSGGKTAASAPRLYMPYPRNLEVVEDERKDPLVALLLRALPLVESRHSTLCKLFPGEQIYAWKEEAAEVLRQMQEVADNNPVD